MDEAQILKRLAACRRVVLCLYAGAAALAALPVQLQNRAATYGADGTEEFFTRHRREIAAAVDLVHSQGGKALLRLTRGRVYLLHTGKSLQMEVPLGIPPKTALESNRVKELWLPAELC